MLNLFMKLSYNTYNMFHWPNLLTLHQGSEILTVFKMDSDKQMPDKSVYACKIKKIINGLHTKIFPIQMFISNHI